MNFRNLFFSGLVLLTGCVWSAEGFLCGCPADEEPHPGHTEVCDGFDNDGDGEIDEDGVCPPDDTDPQDDCTPGTTECSDCVDNDGDGKIDHGVTEGRTNDPQCDSLNDDREGPDPVGNDELGTWGCVYQVETEGANPQLDQDMIAWLASNPRVPHLIVDDFDSDGVPNQVWLDGASIIQSSGIGTATFDHRYLTILDPDGNRVIDDTGCIELGDGDQSCNVALGWHCSSWSNGNPDDLDNDGDGFCEGLWSASTLTWFCTDGSLPGDLDDNSAGNCPDCDEVCGDLVDNNYDGEVDEACLVDNDRDGFTEWPIGDGGGDCNDINASSIHPGAEDFNDNVDQDCDGSLMSDLDGDGAFSNDPAVDLRDCDDYNPDRRPGLPEMADWQDNDCDGAVDEGCEDEDFEVYFDLGVFGECAP